ncbi:sporulation histidine kinase inhibitor Sda [Radiobacillus deserti]|uniref:Sporulation histidine kinase inhibitor Sda n=1 Tax=Radiobacillus deserti TaxID=2594883 RepID=A0A516KJ52_9BACI|nr:sporulation histidine kinase inhibitor Sda [Radiobacillus deserti]QDP41427.1 sporulation histidine kinase inhibitor Sda [Radiobacillus deserti]
MLNISDKQLIEAYYSALELALEDDFIALLEEEIEKRNLSIKIKKKSVN